jgi:uncharacterized protein (DUF4415 family)
MTKAENTRKQNYHYMAQGLLALETALHGRLAKTDGVIPDEWHEISQRPFEAHKERVTLWVEQDVLRFFKSMGKGHTTRMADVVKAFMHARLAGVVRGAEDVDYSRKTTQAEKDLVQAQKEQMREQARARAKMIQSLRR